MAKEIDCREGEEAAERFRKLARTTVGVPKSEIERRAKEWRESRESDKGKDSEE